MITLIIGYIIGYIAMFSYLIINDYNYKKHFYEYKRSGTFKYDVSNITLDDYVGYAMVSILWFCILPILILRYLFKEYINFLIKILTRDVMEIEESTTTKHQSINK